MVDLMRPEIEVTYLHPPRPAAGRPLRHPAAPLSRPEIEVDSSFSLFTKWLTARQELDVAVRAYAQADAALAVIMEP
jgi:hypothetical protein